MAPMGESIATPVTPSPPTCTFLNFLAWAESFRSAVGTGGGKPDDDAVASPEAAAAAAAALACLADSGTLNILVPTELADPLEAAALVPVAHRLGEALNSPTPSEGLGEGKWSTTSSKSNRGEPALLRESSPAMAVSSPVVP